MNLEITREEREGLRKTFEHFGRKKTNEEIFYDLCFCICAPQTKFKNNVIVSQHLYDAGFYNWEIDENNEKEYASDGYYRTITDAVRDLIEICRPIRFYNNKAKYLIGAKQKFNEILSIINFISQSENGNYYKRDWLIDNVKGLGMKSASHFLRNLGDSQLAILDTHIIKFLAKNAVEFKININYDELSFIMHKAVIRRNGYLDLEKMFQKVAKNCNLSTAEFDALIWKRYSGISWKEFKY